MIQKLILLYLLGATCFCLASRTDGQSSHRQQQGQLQNKKTPAQTSWQPTHQQSGNLPANVQQSRSQESENEIVEGENSGAVGGEEPAPVTEDKQLPHQPSHQQLSPATTPPKPVPNKKPAGQPVNPLPYAQEYPNGNHPPGMPITQYSGIQVSGYQNQQTGQAPISQHQQMFYAGGSNSIPMMIYSDSATPPITMFYLGQGDKQIQAAIPNLQPMSPQVYSQGLPSYNFPMPLSVEPMTSPLNSWDRMFPMFETFSPQPFYPPNNVILKTKESQRGGTKSLTPKSGRMNFESELSSIPMSRAAIINMQPTNDMAFNNRFMQPWMLPQNQRIPDMKNLRNVVTPFWSKSMPTSWNEPMARASSNDVAFSILGSSSTSLPTSPFTSGSTSYPGQSYGNKGGHTYGSSGTYSSPSVSTSSGISGSPSSTLYSTTGGQYSSIPGSSYSSGSLGYSSPPFSSRLYTSSGTPLSGSRYPSISSSGSQYSLGSSGYSSGYPRSAFYSSALPTSSSYSANGGQHGSLNQGAHSQSQAGAGSQKLYNHDKQGTSFVQPLPNGGQVSSFSTSQKGFSGASQGQSSLSNSNKKYENQHGVGQSSSGYMAPGGHSSSYLTPGTPHLGGAGATAYLVPSSQINTGLGHTGHLRSAELLGASNSESSQQPNTQAADVQPLEKVTQIIYLVPEGVIMASEPEASSKGQSHSSSISSGSTQSSARSAFLDAQYGLGGIGLGGSGYGTTGLNNQYSNLHNGHLAGQNSGATNNQQFGHENVNTGFVQPLPMGGQVYSSVNSDKGYSGGSFGQGSQSVGVNDQNFNAGGLASNTGYNSLGGLNSGILPGTGLMGGRIGGITGLNSGLGINRALGIGAGGVGVIPQIY